MELQPVFQFDEQDAPAGLTNYWGYSPVSFFTPHSGYSSRSDPLAVLDEFRDMVKVFHRAGIEIILDVVYNYMDANLSWNCEDFAVSSLKLARLAKSPKMFREA